jgi:hypothetical protein
MAGVGGEQPQHLEGFRPNLDGVAVGSAQHARPRSSSNPLKRSTTPLESPELSHGIANIRKISEINRLRFRTTGLNYERQAV